MVASGSEGYAFARRGGGWQSLTGRHTTPCWITAVLFANVLHSFGKQSVVADLLLPAMQVGNQDEDATAG